MAAIESITIACSLRWWVKPLVAFVVIWNALRRREPDIEAIADFVTRYGVKLKVASQRVEPD